MDAKETSLFATVLIISVVVGIILAYFIFSIIRQQRRAAGLYLKSLQTEITTLEKERSRIAADLHDELGPILSAVKLRLGSVDVDDPEDQLEFTKANDQLDLIISRLREISYDLMPRALVTKGFAPALQQYVNYCNKSNKLQIKFSYDAVNFSEKQSLNLYRILQEIINNTIKHAQASTLQIELRKNKDRFTVSTSDNGKGFDYDKKAGEGSGLGLHNLLSRIEMIGGKMIVDSKKYYGTSFLFEAPITEHE